MNIFILESDFKQQTYMERLVQEIIGEYNWPCKNLKIEIYGKPKHLIDAMLNKRDYQVVFLNIDINNGKENGVTLALKIRKLFPYALIIFVAEHTHKELISLIFKRHILVLDYIDKNQSKELFKKDIQSVLVYAYKNYNKGIEKDSLLIETRDMQIQVPFDEILYFESAAIVHKVVLNTSKERIEFYASLFDISKLDNRLYRCHRSFIVNPANILWIDKKTYIAYFKNGTSCFIARKRLKGLLGIIKSLHKLT